MDREHRGDLDLKKLKIKDLELDLKLYKKNNQMFKDHIAERK